MARRRTKSAAARTPAPPPTAVEPESVEVEEPEDEEGDITAEEGAEPDGHTVEVEVDAASAAGDEEPEAVDSDADDRALAPFDPLQRYLTEIRRYPLLSREEEKAIAIRYKEKQDIQAAYQLVTGNLRLVVMIAREYQRATRNLLDLIQEGNIGLMEAVKKFDPYRGIRFPSYAVWWVRAYIIRYLINNWRVVKLGTTQAQRKLFFNLQKEKERLEARRDRTGSDASSRSASTSRNPRSSRWSSAWRRAICRSISRATTTAAACST